MGVVERPWVTRDVSCLRWVVCGNRGRPTMERRKFVIGLGSLAAGGAAATGTGAFTSATAERTVSIARVGDESAYLGLTAGDSAGVSSYVSGSNGGELNIDLTGNGEGSGVNMGAVTTIGESDNGEYDTEYAFKITNQGTQKLFIGLSYDFDDASWLDSNKDQSYIEFEGRGNELEREVGGVDHRRKAQFPFQASGETAGGGAAGGSGRIGKTQPIYGQNRNKNRATLDVGTSWYFVVRVDTSGEDASMSDALSGTLNIHVNSDDKFNILTS